MEVSAAAVQVVAVPQFEIVAAVEFAVALFVVIAVAVAAKSVECLWRF